MQGTIVYPQFATFQVEIPVEAQGSTVDMLRAMWCAANPDSGDETLMRLNSEYKPLKPTKESYGMRSSMVGDIYIVNGETWMVDGCGFVKISQAQSLALQALADRDRLMGWGWITRIYPQIGAPLGKI